MAECDGEMPSYQKVLSMEYLDMVFLEALRLHPALGALQRACVKEYTFPGTNVTIKAGQELFIPVAGIHNDAKYYPNPTVFDPMRFSREEKDKRHP